MGTILYHTWEPGLEGDFNTSGGGAIWTRHLWNEFNKAGHNVYWFTERAMEPLDIRWSPASRVSVAIFCWRWQLPNEERYKVRNMIYHRQNALLKWCIMNRIPIIIHDQDLKMTPAERVWLRDCGAIIATPSLFPDENEISLHFPNPFQYERIRKRENSLVYVGNNYERMDQTVRFFGGEFPKKVPTFLYGNWVETGPGKDPNKIRALLPDVNFPGRLSQILTNLYLGKSRATAMLHKPEYGPRGFTTIRWAEAAAAGVLSFIPNEFALPDKYSLLLAPLRVTDGSQMLQSYEDIGEEGENELIGNLRNFVKEYMTVTPWLRLIERITK